MNKRSYPPTSKKASCTPFNRCASPPSILALATFSRNYAPSLLYSYPYGENAFNLPARQGSRQIPNAICPHLHEPGANREIAGLIKLVSQEIQRYLRGRT